ncbi:multidrug effflux MFS transporter [Pseudoteredinibacter isoporae]|uniref:Bcr/CflA family efflux transporter n=1 Tax=Pseudoteredinibacter isoporae TaxID=570281 RepID=A0A7X0JST5_9GAMM|nr:DHA1 family bicyclomycin/chloramphenicol resistance-like MFS transporter [Pseudoteredinibacter isoporae]
MFNKPQKPLELPEFIALMALMTALVALAIDAMLPALAQIGDELKVDNPNHVQLIIAYLFLGLGVGQIGFGPLSDSIGRKPTIYIGLGIYLFGCLLSMFAQDFDTMLYGRLLQGFGLAAPRVVTMAIVRDLYKGREMARVMSFMMTIFILVPALAPSLGQLVLWIADWRMIFSSFVILGVVIWFWLGLRQPETLPKESRRRFHIVDIAKGFTFVFKQPTAIGYTLAAGFVSGSFVAFLATSQQILEIQLGGGKYFPLLFACLALCLGVASVVNARIVVRYGMRLISRRAIACVMGMACLYSIGIFVLGEPGLLSFMLFLGILLFCVGLVFGNMSSVAMEPLGKLAGIGAAVVGSVSTLISFALGALIGSYYEGSVLPLVISFALCAALALIIVTIADRLESPQEAQQ